MFWRSSGGALVVSCLLGRFGHVLADSCCPYRYEIQNMLNNGTTSLFVDVGHSLTVWKSTDGILYFLVPTPNKSHVQFFLSNIKSPFDRKLLLSSFGSYTVNLRQC